MATWVGVGGVGVYRLAECLYCTALMYTKQARVAGRQAVLGRRYTPGGTRQAV